MVNSEKRGRADSVSYSASAAAIFIGCTSVMILPWASPVIATPRPATSSDDRAGPDGPPVRGSSVDAVRLPRVRCQNAMPMTKARAGHVAPTGSTCGKVTSCTLLKSTAAKSFISARPVSGL